MKNTSIIISQKIYRSFLYLYPDEYRKKFGREMHMVFTDMLSDAYKAEGKIGIFRVWTTMIGDITRSLFSQHMILEKEQTRFAIVFFSSLLLLPSFLFLSIVFLKGIGVQVSNTFLFWLEHNQFYFSLFKASTPIIFIIAPFITLLLNAMQVIKLGIKREHNALVHTFSLQLSLFHIAIIALSGLILAVVMGHVVVDSLPCLYGAKKIC